jgi:hypothetical protein
VNRLTTLVGTSCLLAGCATAYQPHAGDDAARLRVRLGNGFGLTTLWTHVRPVTDGRCGEPVRLGMLSPPVAPATTPRGPSPPEPSPQAPRAGMVGSSDALRTDVGEYALAPRMYQVGLIGTTFGRQCGAVALLALEPGHQYELELWFESAQQRCLIRGTRLEGQVFRPMALKEGSKACA